MAVTGTGYEHIVVGEDGAARVNGTTVKVVELVVERMAYGWSPEELQFQHPELTLGQIYSALAYVWDHRQELEAEVERRLEKARQARREAGPSPLAARLRSQGLLR